MSVWTGWLCVDKTHNKTVDPIVTWQSKACRATRIYATKEALYWRVTFEPGGFFAFSLCWVTKLKDAVKSPFQISSSVRRIYLLCQRQEFNSPQSIYRWLLSMLVSNVLIFVQKEKSALIKKLNKRCQKARNLNNPIFGRWNPHIQYFFQDRAKCDAVLLLTASAPNFIGNYLPQWRVHQVTLILCSKTNMKLNMKVINFKISILITKLTSYSVGDVVCAKEMFWE